MKVGMGISKLNYLKKLIESTSSSLIHNSTNEESTNFGGLDQQINGNSTITEATIPIGQMEYPNELHFNIGEIWPKLQQIGQELGLKCAKKELVISAIGLINFNISAIRVSFSPQNPKICLAKFYCSLTKSTIPIDLSELVNTVIGK